MLKPPFWLVKDPDFSLLSFKSPYFSMVISTYPGWISDFPPFGDLVLLDRVSGASEVRKKFRGYFRGTCSDLSNASMEAGPAMDGR